MWGDRELSSAEYAALIAAAKRVGYSVDEFECIMGFGYAGKGYEHWAEVRAAIERQADHVLSEWKKTGEAF